MQEWSQCSQGQALLSELTLVVRPLWELQFLCIVTVIVPIAHEYNFKLLEEDLSDLVFSVFDCIFTSDLLCPCACAIRAGAYAILLVSCNNKADMQLFD